MLHSVSRHHWLPSLAALSLLLGNSLPAEDLNILMIGNSYTNSGSEWQNVSNNLQGFFDADPDYSASITKRTPGGKQLTQHWADGDFTDGVAREQIINDGPWDFVTLQEQSQLAGLTSLNGDFYGFETAVDNFVGLCRTEDIRVILMSTWGRTDGGESSFGSTAAHLDHTSWAYAAKAHELSVKAAPCGEAWEYAEGLDGTLVLRRDGSHPNDKGAYLAAAALYHSMTGKDPANIGFTGGLSQSDADTLLAAFNGMLAAWESDGTLPLLSTFSPDGTHPNPLFQDPDPVISIVGDATPEDKAITVEALASTPVSTVFAQVQAQPFTPAVVSTTFSNSSTINIPPATAPSITGYSIISGNEDGAFSVDGSGNVILSSAPTNSLGRELVVRATDSNDWTDDATIIINERTEWISAKFGNGNFESGDDGTWVTSGNVPVLKVLTRNSLDGTALASIGTTNPGNEVKGIAQNMGDVLEISKPYLSLSFDALAGVGWDLNETINVRVFVTDPVDTTLWETSYSGTQNGDARIDNITLNSFQLDFSAHLGKDVWIEFYTDNADINSTIFIDNVLLLAGATSTTTRLNKSDFEASEWYLFSTAGSGAVITGGSAVTVDFAASTANSRVSLNTNLEETTFGVGETVTVCFDISLNENVGVKQYGLRTAFVSNNGQTQFSTDQPTTSPLDINYSAFGASFSTNGGAEGSGVNSALYYSTSTEVNGNDVGAPDFKNVIRSVGSNSFEGKSIGTSLLSGQTYRLSLTYERTNSRTLIGTTSVNGVVVVDGESYDVERETDIDNFNQFVIGLNDTATQTDAGFTIDNVRILMTTDSPLPPVNFTASTANAAEGSVDTSLNGTYLEGDTVEILAVPEPGFAFAYWSGDVDSFENPLPLTLTADTSITANFVAATPTKNIILIMADDISYDNYGAYGSTVFNTPNIDSLASTGLRFDRAYATPVCTPTRVRLMTGRDASRPGNYEGFRKLSSTERTFVPLLKGAGYKTAIAGKWQLDIGGGTAPEDTGFDTWLLNNTELTGTGSGTIRYWDTVNPPTETVGLETDQLNLLSVTTDDYGPDKCVEFILDFITENQNEEFMVYYPMLLVHDPFKATPDSADRFESDINANYRDMVEYMDKLVGQIVTKLDELNLRNDTIILITGDNGTDRALTYEFGGETLMGRKGYTDDRGHHVALIANCPGTIPVGVNDDLIDFSDFFPTLADIAQVDVPSDRPIDGRSFYPQLLGQEGNPKRIIYQTYYPVGNITSYYGLSGGQSMSWAHTKDYKLYELNESGGIHTATNRFFNITNDPEEESPIEFANATTDEQAIWIELQAVLDAMPQDQSTVSYASFQDRYFTGAEVRAGLAERSFDANGDGLTNEDAYILVLSPDQGSGAAVSPENRIENNQTFPQLRFKRRIDVAANYSIEMTTTLDPPAWSPVESNLSLVGRTNNGDGTETVVFEYQQALGTDPLFFRLNASL